MENIQLNAPNILHFENKFRNIIYEIQEHTKALDKLEKKHFLICEELCSKESLLQNERRISHDLRARLKLAVDTINRLEEEKIRDKINYSNVLINYDSVIKERDILVKETLSSKTEAATFKMKIECLENTLGREIRKKEELEKALIELKNDNEKIIANIDMNIAKISKEQKYLLESSRSIICLNKQLQTFGLCSYAIHDQNRTEIKNLRHKLISYSTNKLKSLSANDKLHPEIETLLFKLKEMSMELKSKTQNSTAIEENLNKIFQELSHKYNTTK